MQRNKCSYCFKKRPLVNNKSYCVVCSRDAVECNKCHRPLPQRRVNDDGICKACTNKTRRYQIGFVGEATTLELLLTSESQVDVLKTLVDVREEAEDD